MTNTNQNRPVPKIISYLGRTLPAAMMGLLVVYSLRLSLIHI